MSRPDVLVLNGIPPETSGTPGDLVSELEARLPDVDFHLATDYADAAERIPEATVIVEHGIDDELVASAARARWIQSLSAGVDRFDLDDLRGREIVLTSVSGVHANPIAEQVLGYLLLFERDLLRGLHQQRHGVWRRYPAGELGGKTLGIVGVGAIGGRIAELGRALGMTVVGTKRDPTTAPSAVDDIYGPDGLHRLLGQSDYVVLSLPLTDETRGMIGPRELSSMSSDAVLVNVARGAIVDQAALVEALQTGYLGGAALDVAETEPLPPESPLWDMENVIVTPHNAGGTPHFPARCADIFAENYERFVEGDLDAMVNRAV